MATGRSSPSGKALQLTPDLAVSGSGNPAQGTLNAPAIPPNTVATAVSLSNFAPGGCTYLCAMNSTISSNGVNDASGAVKLLFTPASGPVRTINSRAFSTGSSNTQFRLMPQIVDIAEPGTLSIVFDTAGSLENLNVENGDASIQPITIVTK